MPTTAPRWMTPRPTTVVQHSGGRSEVLGAEREID